MRCCQCASCGAKPGRGTTEMWRHEVLHIRILAVYMGILENYNYNSLGLESVDQ